MKRLFLCLAWWSAWPLAAQVVTGAQQLDQLLARLSGKRVALMVNQTSVINQTHLADSLLARGVKIAKVFSPEHGFRGKADAGEKVSDAIDAKSGLPIVSLYGSNKKATPAQLADIDVVVFDIQDVGTRFFTYISSLHYLMESCAENKKKLIVLDRPNPNGSYVDGPVMQPQHKSFVGMHPIPVVHGLTIGEIAKMINGEGWLEGKVTCELEVVTMKHWKHSDAYSLPIRPSPNLPTDNGIRWYPSTCFFEGTALSVGRGTQNPFEFIGHPDLKNQPFQFTPVSIDGMAKKPPFENVVCFGLDLRKETAPRKVSLQHLIELYQAFPDKEKFFTNYFEKLAGTDELRKQIQSGMTEEQIRKTWQKDLAAYGSMRKKYLLYP
ncbi:MAG: DUF1343 domain-containing protein [Cyclobacteriaceae bacterium]|nr:DUF1343 domain-containing protein [Cyclobacteriaceae bacterium]